MGKGITQDYIRKTVARGGVFLDRLSGMAL